MDESHYLLNDEQFMKIEDLCEGLSLAINKIIRSSKFNTIRVWQHPAISGFEEMIASELSDGKGILDEIF